MTDAEGNLTGQAQGRWESVTTANPYIPPESRPNAIRRGGWGPETGPSLLGEELANYVNDLEARLSQALEELYVAKSAAQSWQETAIAAEQRGEQAKERARVAVALADRAYWMVEVFDALGTGSHGEQYEKDEAERQQWLADYDTLTAADAAEEPRIKLTLKTGPQVSDGQWLQRPRLVRHKPADAAEGGD